MKVRFFRNAAGWPYGNQNQRHNADSLSSAEETATADRILKAGKLQRTSNQLQQLKYFVYLIC
jgi:hypothetical protein